MRAVVFDDPGDESVLDVREIPAPSPGPGELLIRVAAAGVNRADLLQRRGLYPPPPGASPLLGLECSGTVLEIGSGVEDFAPGDRVMALLTGGGYAEQVVAPELCAMRIPDAVTEVDAAAVPEVFLTAFLNLFMIGGLTEGTTALVHGGSGGIGTAAIQLAKSAGVRVFVTAGTPERCRRCLELGADAAFDYHSRDFVAEALEMTAGRGVDVVFDCIGAAYLQRHIDVLAIGGRLVVIGLQGGTRAELDLSRVLIKRLSILGSTLRARTVADKASIIHGFLDRFGRDLQTGRLRPIVERVLSFDQAAEAHRLLAAGKVFGKLVLRP